MNKKSVLVTGSSRGIGRACAIALQKPDIMYLSTAVKISPFFILYRMRFFPVAVPVPFFPEMSVIRPR